ncbi:hypothetical protein LINPERHAP1_LOCUS14614, partial [Linum perenne]
NVRLAVLIPLVLTVRRLDFKRASYAPQTKLQHSETSVTESAKSHEFQHQPLNFSS